MVTVTKEVYDGIVMVQNLVKGDLERVNISDYKVVAMLCAKFGYMEASLWVLNNKSLYVKGVLEGFEKS